ncbi:MAG: hypothetical protein QM736_13945 [Vicinamibacterales bacterium]
MSYFSPDTGVVFVGDTCGVRVTPGGFVLPPTPPPDIDLPLWFNSLSTIEAWRPDTLMLTHFGPSHPVSAHLAELRDHLQLTERLAREALAQPGDDAARERYFINRLRDGSESSDDAVGTAGVQSGGAVQSELAGDAALPHETREVAQHRGAAFC